MAALTKSVTRNLKVDSKARHKVVASDILYQGGLMFESGTTGNVGPVTGNFVGVALEEVDNSGGSAGAKDIDVADEGVIEVNVTGVTGTTDHGRTVYATTDNDLQLNTTGGNAIGKIVERISGTLCRVHFQAHYRRSI